MVSAHEYGADDALDMRRKNQVGFVRTNAELEDKQDRNKVRCSVAKLEEVNEPMNQTKSFLLGGAKAWQTTQSMKDSGRITNTRVSVTQKQLGPKTLRRRHRGSKR